MPQLQINSRLILPFIILLTAFNILPFGLLSFKNLDPLKVLSLFIFLFALLSVRNLLSKDTIYVSLFIGTIILSALNMFSRGKYMDWTFFYCLNYFNFFLLLISFQNMNDILDYVKLVFGLSILASFLHLIFYLFPVLLAGKLNEIRMGSINSDASRIRVFIPGMGFIAICFTYLIAKLVYFKRLSFAGYCTLLIFFCSITIFASVRTYLLGIFVVLISFLLLKKLSFKKIIYFSGIAFLAVLIVSLVSADLWQFLGERLNIFTQLGEFKFLDAIQLNIDYDTETTFGTVYFRIMEVIYVLNNYSSGMREILFGNMGTLYDFLGVEQETAPHISLFGIYYLFGAIGLAFFCLMFINFTKLIIRNVRKFADTKFEFFSIVVAVLWFTLFVISFFGGIYYSELILMVTFIMAAATFMKKYSFDEQPED
jgi:hypothetical protein